ncbi:MAG: YfhO family protein [Candidatus Eiseniibacteriota bacterium]
MTPRRSGKQAAAASAGRGTRPAAPDPVGAALAGPWGYAIAAVLILVFFYPITLGKVFISPDSVAPMGLTKIANDALTLRHVYPLWNPYHFLGMPSFGSLAFIPYAYPPDPLFGFLNKGLGFPDLTWLLAHYLLLGLAMVALLRSLGASAEAALFGGVTLALTPNLVAVGAFGHGSQIMTAAYLPLLILLFDRFARRGSWLALAGFAFAAAFQLLRGHVQIVFYSWIALTGYALFLAVAAFRGGRRDEGWRTILGLAGGLGLGFGMSAFLYLPVHEYAGLSTRGGGEGGGAGMAYATSWSFHPREMLTFLIPSFFGFGGPTYWGSMPFTDYPNYMGIVPLALAAYAAVRARGTLRAYLTVLIAVALLISFGKHFMPLYALLYDHLPFFNKFRVPVMILFLVQFATATLAALGLTMALWPERTGRKGGDDGSLWLRASVIAVVSGFAALLVINIFGDSIREHAIRSRPNFDMAHARAALDLATIDALKSGIFLSMGLAFIGLARRGRIVASVAALLVVGVTAVDLWTVDRKIIDPQVATTKEYDNSFRETPEIAFLRTDSTQFRVFPLRWDDSRLAAFGIASVLGYHPAKPRLYQGFVDTVGIQSFETLQFFNVKYVLAEGYFPAGMPGVILRKDGDVKVYEVEGILPRAFVAHAIRRVRDDSVALAVIRTHGFDFHREALWSEPGEPPPVAPPGEPDSVRTVHYDFNEVDYVVSTSAPGLLVTVEEYDPDWVVTVDGKPSTIHRVNYLMRGVPLAPGIHRVHFAYAPRSLAAGIRISAASAIATLLLAGFGMWSAVSRRRSGARGGKGAEAAAPGGGDAA